MIQLAASTYVRTCAWNLLAVRMHVPLQRHHVHISYGHMGSLCECAM